MLNKKRSKLKDHSTNNSFLSKLYDILKNNSYKKIIHWNDKGTSIIISDKNKLCETILPKFYKHNNYSSFVRQLNLYGFRKCQGIIKDGDAFENEKFNKKISKEQINKITKKNMKIESLSKYIKNNKKNDLNDNDEELSFNNENDILKYLLEKNKENNDNITGLKQEVLELKNQNKILFENIQAYTYGHSVIIKKIMETKKNKIDYVQKKSKDLKELFKKYLYYLKIYSPYIIINNKNNKYYINEKVESFQINSINNPKKIILNRNNNYNNSNPDSFFSENSFFKNRPYNPIFDLSLYNNNSSNIFLNNKKI